MLLCVAAGAQMQDFIVLVFCHRFQGVVEQVDEHALHLFRIKVEIGSGRIEVLLHEDIRNSSVIETQGIFKDAIHVCIFGTIFGKAGEPGKFVHKPFERIGFLDDDLDAFGKQRVKFCQLSCEAPGHRASSAGTICW